MKLFLNEPNIVYIRAPLKIFGNLNGNFPDLLRLFDSFGEPSDQGDIDSTNYLFLGNNNLV